MLELEGTPQDIVDFRRQHVPGLIFHACPECGENSTPSGRDPDQPDAGPSSLGVRNQFTPALAPRRIRARREPHPHRPRQATRNPVPPKPASMDFSSVSDLIRKDLEQTGATADEMTRVVEESVVQVA